MNEFFQMLKKDHEVVKHLLEQLVATKASAPKKRDELFQKLRKELVPHMKAEESAFYPRLVAKEESRVDAMEGVEEHHVSEIVLKELEAMQKGEDRWGSKMTVFKELVEHHIEDEQRKVFKSAKEALNNEELEHIMKQFIQAKQAVVKNLRDEGPTQIAAARQ